MSSVPTSSRVSRGKGPREHRKLGLLSTGKQNGTRNALEGVSQDPEDDGDLCVICAEEIKFAAYTPCQHKVCHKCCLRQRVLYEKDICLICRTPNEFVVISEDIDSHTEFDTASMLWHESYKIYFANEKTQQACVELLEYKCSIKGCGEKFSSFKELQNHTKSEHNRHFCLICYNNKKAFINELELYYHKALQTHQTVGDGKGFKGHPACKHCVKKRFYSEDELNVHIRDSHERCHICDQDTPATADYYKNYYSLYDHFKQDHFVCTVQSCLDKKFVVFREDLDLTAHMLKEHGSITGANNKIVFGAGRAYQSQLSTYQRPRGPRAADADSDDFNVKKLRLEERAKHYLEYDNTKQEQFLALNNKFKSGTLSATELTEEYKRLFTNQTTEEIVILLTEHAELFTESNSKHTALNQAIESISKNARASDFPILGGSAAGSTLNPHGWGSANSSHRSSPIDKFPALSKPSAKKPVINNKPIKYTTIRNVAQPKPVSVNIATFNNDTTFRPSYLDNSSPSPAAPSSSKQAELSKFPKLEKKTTKKVFPRVSPVIVPPAHEWGTPKAEAQAPQDDWFGIPVKDKRKQKQRKQ